MLMRWRTASPSTAWLSVTPEPERLLPDAVATLARGARPPAGDVERERERLERLIRRARRRDWLAYLSGALALALERRGAADADVIRARRLAVDVISNHHRLLLGIPGADGPQTAAERAQLAAAATPERSTHDQGPDTTG